MALTGSSPEPEAGTRSMLTRLSERLAATRKSLSSGFANLLGTQQAPDAAQLEELEDALLQADVGVDASARIVAKIRTQPDPGSLHTTLRTALLELIAPCEKPLVIPRQTGPFVIMVVGVNGAGKTTTIGKLAHRLQAQGYKVMLAAADTFRAAAVEQLKVWGERNGVPVVAQDAGADAAAVAHDALHAASARGMDVLIVDTAGRLHTQSGLMDELKKIRRVIERIHPQAPHEVLLVLDAGIGQNALAQREHFQAAVGVTGLVLTKLDGTAKGGVLFAIAAKNPLPIRFIGVGEGIEDLRVFSAAEFVEAILPEDQ
ncbi:MAG TPA: signal recognition particle-docking protein FtsY [Acidiferrobacterales bacterium]|nr:signal recognition particle-docking protein FtsY [Acidiferrobacterales bacterium]